MQNYINISMILGKKYRVCGGILKNFICLPLLILLLYGCSPYNEQVKKEYDSSHYSTLYKTLEQATQKKNNDLLLWQMQSGFLTFSYFAPHFSLDDLEKAEVLFKGYESEGLLSNVGANIGATLSNDMAMPYKGYIYEGSLLNFYKALAFSSIGDSANARIEFNRANDRQRRAKEYYQKEVKKAHDDAVKAANEKQANTDYANNTTDSSINTILNEKYSNLKNFAIYKDLINPVIPYISGIFFMIEKDFTKSIDLLKEAYGISQADIIANDMQILEARKFAGSYPHFTWILIEDGDIARIDGFATTIPIILHNGINSVNLALPYLKDGKANFQTYQINDINADKITQVSQLFGSEFEKRLPAIITRAIISAIVKFTISYSFNEFGGSYGAIAGLVTTLIFSAVTDTDTRMSLILPDTVWAAKIPNTESKIQIMGDNHLITELSITTDCDSLPKRQKKNVEFDSLLKAKSQDLSARIHFLKHSNFDNVVCATTDNIVYVRVRHNKATHFIVKGD